MDYKNAEMGPNQYKLIKQKTNINTVILRKKNQMNRSKKNSKTIEELSIM